MDAIVARENLDTVIYAIEKLLGYEDILTGDANAVKVNVSDALKNLMSQFQTEEDVQNFYLRLSSAFERLSALKDELDLYNIQVIDVEPHNYFNLGRQTYLKMLGILMKEQTLIKFTPKVNDDLLNIVTQSLSFNRREFKIHRILYTLIYMNEHVYSNVVARFIYTQHTIHNDKKQATTGN